MPPPWIPFLRLCWWRLHVYPCSPLLNFDLYRMEFCRAWLSDFFSSYLHPCLWSSAAFMLMIPSWFHQSWLIPRTPGLNMPLPAPSLECHVILSLYVETLSPPVFTPQTRCSGQMLLCPPISLSPKYNFQKIALLSSRPLQPAWPQINKSPWFCTWFLASVLYFLPICSLFSIQQTQRSLIPSTNID